MFEPSSPASTPIPPPRVPPPSPSPDGRALRLLGEVRTAQARALQTQGVLWSVVVFLVFLVAGSWVGAFTPRAGLGLIIGGGLAALSLVVLFGLVLPRRRVGDDARTARMLATQLPELNLDLLAAVELSRALGTREDFSPELARAFLRDVDARASRLTVAKLIDQRPTQRAAMALVATVFVVLALLVFKGATLRAGLAMALMPAEAAEPLRRQPITGDVELTYRYPVHTGLEVRTIPSSTGDVSAPAGTEVTLKTRADRDVEGAALVLNPGSKRVPLRVERRELTGSFVVSESGTYHVVFLEGSDVVAEGPDQSITVEADQPPQARITSPVDGLELDPTKQALTIKFDASDDYGLSALDLVFTPEGRRAPPRLAQARRRAHHARQLPVGPRAARAAAGAGRHLLPRGHRQRRGEGPQEGHLGGAAAQAVQLGRAPPRSAGQGRRAVGAPGRPPRRPHGGRRIARAPRPSTPRWPASPSTSAACSSPATSPPWPSELREERDPSEELLARPCSTSAPS